MRYKNEDHIQADVRTLDFKIVKISDVKNKIMFEFHKDIKNWIPA